MQSDQDSDHADLKDDLLPGVAAIAEFTGEKRRRTQYLVDTNQIPTFKIGARIYGRKSELRQVYSSQRSGG